MCCRNRYTYARNNPVKYNDPSGHIANTPHERLRAHEIWRLLAQYGVSINHDWGWVEQMTSGGNLPPREGLSELTWQEGSWELSELESVLQGVSDLADLLGGIAEFKQRVGPAHIWRIQKTKMGKVKGEPAEFLGLHMPVVKWIRLYNGCFKNEATAKATVVHELAHAWDNSPGEWGSELIDQVIGKWRRPTGYAYTNPREHWAETVKARVYNRQALSPWHEEFMALAVRGWEGPVVGPAGP